MTKELIIVDSRLFLFQVMEYGLNKKLINDKVIDKFKNQGVQMSFAFAKRYYSVVYESYLRHASNCILGIVNLGLIETSGRQLNDATMILIQKGHVRLFREGWTRVLKLVKYAWNADRNTYKSEFEWEKDFAELFSAEPGREWIGYEEYMKNILIYSNKNRGENER